MTATELGMTSRRWKNLMVLIFVVFPMHDGFEQAAGRVDRGV